MYMQDDLGNSTGGKHKGEKFVISYLFDTMIKRNVDVDKDCKAK